MSYCRTTDPESDIYLYMDTNYRLTCICPTGLVTLNYIHMYQHLKEHERVGKKVPQKAYDRMISESKELRNYLNV